jgi:hypothetical protein
MHDYVCEADATVRVRIPITARNADAAAGSVGDEMVVAALFELRGSGLRFAADTPVVGGGRFAALPGGQAPAAAALAAVPARRRRLPQR